VHAYLLTERCCSVWSLPLPNPWTNS
jgi:hypothetical protein